MRYPHAPKFPLNPRLYNLKFVFVVEYVASSDDDDDEVISPSEDLSKPFGEDENKSEGGEDDELVGRYFESLGTSSPAQKVDEQIAEPPPLDTDKLMRTRLSISARFLSRSHQPGRYANEKIERKLVFALCKYISEKKQKGMSA